MDFLVGYVELIGNYIAWGIELVTGWRPDESTKSIIDWIGGITAAITGVASVLGLVRGTRALTKRDLEPLAGKSDLGTLVTKADVAKLRAELLATLAQIEAKSPSVVGGQMDAPASSGVERDLNAAIDTLLEAGRADALKDKTGVAAEAAIDALIAERAAARERVAKDEAALWRQKGALAFLHDTNTALRAYTHAVELDPDAEGWNELGRLQQRVGDLEAATQSHQKVLALGDRMADQAVVAIATGNLGNAYHMLGDFAHAEAMYRKALAVNKTLGRKVGVAIQSGNLGIIYLMRGDLGQAEKMLRETLALNEALGRKDGIAANYGNLGVFYQMLSQFSHAEEMYRKAIALEKELGREEGVAIHYGNLGVVHQTRGNLDQAEAMYREALALNRKLGRKEGMASDYGNLGNVYRARGDLGEACVHFQKARDLFREIGAKARVEQVEGSMREAGCPAA